MAKCISIFNQKDIQKMDLRRNQNQESSKTQDTQQKFQLRTLEETQKTD